MTPPLALTTKVPRPSRTERVPSDCSKVGAAAAAGTPSAIMARAISRAFILKKSIHLGSVRVLSAT
jgi:hypothetical protein